MHMEEDLKEMCKMQSQLELLKHKSEQFDQDYGIQRWAPTVSINQVKIYNILCGCAKMIF